LDRIKSLPVCDNVKAWSNGSKIRLCFKKAGDSISFCKYLVWCLDRFDSNDSAVMRDTFTPLRSNAHHARNTCVVSVSSNIVDISHFIFFCNSCIVFSALSSVSHAAVSSNICHLHFINSGYLLMKYSCIFSASEGNSDPDVFHHEKMIVFISGFSLKYSIAAKTRLFVTPHKTTNGALVVVLEYDGVLLWIIIENK